MMKKIFQRVMGICLLFLLISTTCWGSPFTLTEGPIIADHTIIDDFDKIPDHYMDIVKTMLVVIPGASHSCGYFYGLELLDAINQEYAVETKWRLSPREKLEKTAGDALVVSRTYKKDITTPFWSISAGEEDFWTNQAVINKMKDFLTYQKDNGAPLTAFGFGWCWDMTWHKPEGEVDPIYGVRWAGSSIGGPDGDRIWGIDDQDYILTGNRVNLYTYIDAVVEYNKHEPGTVTFFTTGPVDGNHGTEGGYQRYLKHREIREYVKENGGVLFDYADILCWDEHNQQYMDEWKNLFGEDVYFQNGVPTLATGGKGYGIVGGEHDLDSDGFDDDYGIALQGGCHISREGCIRLGKAMWWMLARIAGWDGKTADFTGPEIASVESGSATTVNITFNEKINETSIKNLNNYSISGGVSVEDAMLSYDGTTITLNTSPHQPATYFITVSGIKDQAGNTMNTAVEEYSFSGGINEGLRAYWNLNEAEGDLITDLSGDGNNAQLDEEPRTPARGPGKSGNGLYFDGVDDRVTINTDDLDYASKTVTFWVKLDSLKSYDTGYYSLLYADSRGNYVAFTCQKELRICWSNGENGSAVVQTPDLAPVLNEWAFYAIVYDVFGDNVGIRVYKNGLPVYDNELAVGMTPYPLKYLGNRQYGSNLALCGALDEVRIYDRPLSQGEISQIYNVLPNDYMPPAKIEKVNDGPGDDISFTNSTTTLSANWSASSDPESGIARYWYAIGTAPGGTDVLDWTDNGKELSVTATGLSLIEGRTYHVSVKAENGNGMLSTWQSSDGQVVDLDLHSDLNTGLVAYWQFDENDGMEVNDISVNGLNAQLGEESRTPIRVVGKSGNSLLFDGDDDCLVAPDHEILCLESKTVAFWVKLDSLKSIDTGYYSMIYEDFYGKYVSFTCYKDLIICWDNGESGVSIGAPNLAPNLNEWTFYTIVYDVSEDYVSIMVYKNGQMVYSTDVSGSIVPNQIKYIGSRRYPNSTSLSGALDDFRIYNRPLTQAEVEELYQISLN